MADHTERDHTDGDHELAALRAMGRSVGVEPVTWEAPPADLWSRIAAEADLDGDPDAGTLDSALSPAPSTVGDDRHDAGNVVPLRARRRTPWILGAAAALVLIAGVVAVAVAGRTDPEQTVLASSTLDALELAPDGAQGAAELVEVDGQLRLRLDVSGLGADEFHEVWVIDSGVSQLISLGPIRADGTYDLPAGIDPQAFPIVDVSIEPLDGDPTHSGNSVLRGQLTF